MSSICNKQQCAESLATVGPIGWVPMAQGTAGSLFAVVIWWLLLSRFKRMNQFWVVILTTIVGIWCSGRAERTFGKDASPIVIDEVAGQWLALMACPRRQGFAVLAFLLFRLFDIWKPYPIRDSQLLRGGTGVVVDDLLAGIYSLLVLRVVRWVRGV